MVFTILASYCSLVAPCFELTSYDASIVIMTLVKYDGNGFYNTGHRLPATFSYLVSGLQCDRLPVLRGPEPEHAAAGQAGPEAVHGWQD